MRKALLFGIIIAVTLFSCGDDDDDMTPEIPFFTYIAGGDKLIILTDQQGNLIDSAFVFGADTTTFTGDPTITRFTVTEVRVDDEFIRVRSYFDVASRIWNQNPPPGSPGVEEVPLAVDVDPSFHRFLISTPRSSDEFIRPDFPTTINFTPSQPIYAASRIDFDTPRYALYDGLEIGDELNIRPTDFVDMEFQAVDFGLDQENVFSVSMFARRSPNDPLYWIDFHVINRPSNVNAPSGLYYPGDAFQYYETSFSYVLDNGTGSIVVRGDIPTEMLPLEINQINVEDEITRYSATAEGEFSSVSSIWFEDGKSWRIVGQSGTNYAPENIISIIEGIYPEFDLRNMIYQDTRFSDHGGNSYDQYIENVFTPGTVHESGNVIKSFTVPFP